MVETIIDLLAKQFRIDPATIDADTNIVEDLGADSLEIVDMLMAIEENFGITVSDEEALTLKTVKDVADFIEENLNPRGVAVFIEAEHLCMTMRGARAAGALTQTSALRGCMRTEAKTRNEVMLLLAK